MVMAADARQNLTLWHGSTYSVSSLRRVFYNFQIVTVTLIYCCLCGNTPFSRPSSFADNAACDDKNEVFLVVVLYNPLLPRRYPSLTSPKDLVPN
jgi:hypothetical protein